MANESDNTTRYYDLIKIALSDKYGIDVYNANLEKIDNALFALEERITALENQN